MSEESESGNSELEVSYIDPEGDLDMERQNQRTSDYQALEDKLASIMHVEPLISLYGEVCVLYAMEGLRIRQMSSYGQKTPMREAEIDDMCTIAFNGLKERLIKLIEYTYAVQIKGTDAKIPRS